MCDFGAEILACLHRIEAQNASDKYENLGFWTVGGGNALYSIKGPANTEAEWCLYSISTTGACQIQISQNQQMNQLAITGGVNYGAGGGNENNGLEGLFYAYAAASAGAPIATELWTPLGKGSSLYILISGLSSASAFVVISFRRSLNHEIPAPRRQIPATHTTRQSTTTQRAALGHPLPGAGQFGQGYDAQYPLPGKFYKHVVVPSTTDEGALQGQIGVPQTQAQLTLARLRGKRGQNE